MRSLLCLVRSETYHPATRRFDRYGNINLWKTWPLSSDTYYSSKVYFQSSKRIYSVKLWFQSVVQRLCVQVYLCTFYPFQSQVQVMTVTLSSALLHSEVNFVEIQVGSSRWNLLYMEHKTIVQTCYTRNPHIQERRWDSNTQFWIRLYACKTWLHKI